MRLYDVYVNQVRSSYKHKQPVLDSCFSDAVHCYSGGLDKTLREFDFNTSTEKLLGTHSEPIRCVNYSQDLRKALIFSLCPSSLSSFDSGPNPHHHSFHFVGTVISGGWDKMINLWDPRNPTPLVVLFGRLFTLPVEHRALTLPLLLFSGFL